MTLPGPGRQLPGPRQTKAATKVPRGARKE